jgi:hydrogenase expression/formation protein HypC
MCLGVPAEIISIKDKTAIVDIWGVRKETRLDTLETRVTPGDFVIDHAGYAVRRIAPEDVADTLALYEILLTEAGEDPIAGDVAVRLETQIEELELV